MVVASELGVVYVLRIPTLGRLLAKEQRPLSRLQANERSDFTVDGIPDDIQDCPLTSPEDTSVHSHSTHKITVLWERFHMIPVELSENKRKYWAYLEKKISFYFQAFL